MEAEWEERRVMSVIDGLVSDAWSVIEPNLDALTDDEYLWEPVEGCWSIRRRSTAVGSDHWGKGDWVVETSLDGSSEPNATTIAWRLLHAYDCFTDYASKAFGHGARDWNEIEVPPHAATAVQMMTDAVAALREDLRAHDDDVLLGPSEDAWGRPRWRLLDTALLEWIHHCAEIGVLRTLYRHPYRARLPGCGWVAGVK